MPGQVTSISDPDWADGARLIDFMIYNAEGGPGESIHCGVIMSLQVKDGRTLKKDVTYSLGGSGPFVVTRESEK